MGFVASLLVLVGPWLQGASAAPVRPPLERPGLLELTLPERSGARSEFFRLDPAGATAEPLGVARLFRAEGAAGESLEWETRFFDPDVRIFHVETLGRDTLALAWREVGPRHGRSVRMSLDLAANFVHVADTAGGSVRQRELELGSGAFAPLFLVELLRAGRLSPGEYRRLEPNAGAIAPLLLELDPLPGTLHRGWRLASWRRPDGSSAGRFLFAGEKLLACELQAGGLVARAIPEAEYQALCASREGLANR